MTDRRTVHRRLIRPEAVKAVSFMYRRDDSKNVDRFVWVVSSWLLGAGLAVAFAMVRKAPLKGVDDDLAAIRTP